jgi:superfamily II DNA or RNA helicase
MPKSEIHIYGPSSILKGEYPRLAIKEATSWAEPGAQFSPAFRRGVWDGRKHLFRAQNGSFPTGLVPTITKVLEEYNYDYVVHDYRQKPTPHIKHPRVGQFEMPTASMTGKYDYQLEVCEKMVNGMQGIVKLATNGGKTNIAAAVTQYLGLNTLFIVTTRELLHQARKRFMSLLEVGEDQVGLVGDGIWEPGSWVTIATLDTLESRIDTKECQELLKHTEVLFIDECHHAGSETWYTVATICPAFYRFGLSGTPLDRTDGANLRLIAACGDIIVNIPNKFLVDRGISAKAHIIFDKVTEPSLLADKTKHKYPSVYKKCVVENVNLIQKVVEWAKVFRQLNMGTLILCEEIAHGRAIDDALWTKAGDVFLPHQFIHGNEDTDTRAQALSDFASGNLPILVASTILDEGVDVPTIDALILAGSRKSRIKTMQRLGRGLRGKQLVVVEFANFCHGFLLEHSKQRLLDYKSEDCFPIHKSAPSVDLVKKIMEETT